MKVSIIVPVYNVEKYVPKCIKSLLKQTYSNLEIILVDDGSKDSSGVICDEFSRDDDRIKVIHKKNGGVVSARKAALPYITGDYVCNVDGDDWINEDYIMQFVTKIHESNADLIWNVSFTKEFENRDEIQLPSGINKSTINNYNAKQWAKKMLYGKYGFQNEIDYSLWCICVEKYIYIKCQKNANEDIARGEDLVLALYILNSVKNIDFICYEGYHYVQRCDSNTNKTNGYSIKEFEILKDEFRKLIKSYAERKQELTAIMDGYCAITYLNYFFGSYDEEEYLYPFTKVKKGARVVVYGAGNIGRNIVGHLINNEYYILNGWINTTIPKENIFKIDIKKVVDIGTLKYDYIIIATNRKIYVNQMKENLKALGVKEEKIVSIFD
uniref:glycosyltransferase family 2 protein n=1 Tax=Lachnospira eligens TaxID=39485 RepID=UPI004026CE0C